MPLEKSYPNQVLEKLDTIISNGGGSGGGGGGGSSGDASAANQVIANQSLANIESTLSGVASVTDSSGSITIGGDAQELMPINLVRKGFYVQNTSAADLYINWITTADVLSLKLSAGALYEWPSTLVPTGAISIFGATTGQTYFAGEF
jgi:hypothetical protein